MALRLFIATAIARGQIVDLDPGVLAHLVGGLALLGGLLIARAGDPEDDQSGARPGARARCSEAWLRARSAEPGGLLQRDRGLA